MMGLDTTAGSITFIVAGALFVVILLKVLFMVHKQTKRVKELEAQMKIMEKTEEATVTTTEGGEK